MRQKMAVFKERNSVCRGYNFFQGLGDPSGGGLRIVSGGAWGDNKGDDATENDNFQRGKQRLQGPNFFQELPKGVTAFAGTQKFQVEF